MGTRTRRTLKAITIAGMLGAAAWLSLQPPGTISSRARAAEPVAAQPSPAEPAETIDAATYGGVQSLRSELHFTNLDLASAGCTAAQAQGVMRMFKAWYGANHQELDRVDASVHAARANLEHVLHDINVGPKDQAVLNSFGPISQTFEDTKRQRAALLDKAIATAALVITSEQLQVLRSAAANDDLPDRYQYLTLTDAQREAVRSPKQHAGELVAIDAIAQPKLQSVNAARSANLAAITAMEAQELPLPPELLSATAIPPSITDNPAVIKP